MPYLSSLSGRAARRRTILALAAVAFMLQAWRLLHPQPLLLAVADQTTPGPSVSRAPAGAPRTSGGPGPTLTVPPPPGVPIPEGAVLLYESPGASAGGATRQLYPTDLLRGLVLLEREGRLALSAEQARQLLPAVRDLGQGYQEMRQAREALLQVLTPEQVQWLEEHPPAEGERPTGAPEQTAEPLARKAAEALR